MTASISRRDMLKGAGALIVSFNLFGSVSQIFAQGAQGGTPISNAGGLSPDQLDSWIAIAPDGTVTVFTSKVDLGTGTGTALGQIVAEELDVPISKIRMEIGDTEKSVDQGRTSASRTLERAGPQMRQAGAAARQELLNRASSNLDAPIEKLTVKDGLVSVVNAPERTVTYAALVGGKRFDTSIAASGEQWDLKVAPNVKAKDPKDYKVVGTSVQRFDLPQKFTGEFTYSADVRLPGMLHGRVVRPPVINSEPASCGRIIHFADSWSREGRSRGQFSGRSGGNGMGRHSRRARTESYLDRPRQTLSGESAGDVWIPGNDQEFRRSQRHGEGQRRRFHNAGGKDFR